MLVLDASVISEFLVLSPLGQLAAAHIAEHDGELHIPHLAVIETASVLRAWVRRDEVSEQRAASALDDLADLPARRWPAEPLLPRVWELRSNISAHDASYLALAELLDAELLTADRRLARSASDLRTCSVTVVPAETD